MEQKRRIIPPLWLPFTLIAMWLLHRWWPLVKVSGPWADVLGGALIVAGILIAGTSAGAFKRAGTPVIPFEKSTALVTGGFYRYTRNPMYLGMVLLLLGVALMLGSASALLPIPVFIAIIRSRFIAGEEKFLEDIFGEPYLEVQTQSEALALTVQSLNHYNLRVPHDALDAFEAFYVDVLGFDARREPPKLFWLYAAGQPLVHVTFLDDADSAAEGAGRTTGVLDHVAFTCDGLEATIERFRSKNVTYSRLDLPDRGFTQLVVYDPLGLKIELNFAGPVQ